jgi:hypothetical protein
MTLKGRSKNYEGRYSFGKCRGEAKQRPAFKAEIIWRLAAREVFVARQAKRLPFNVCVPAFLIGCLPNSYLRKR